MTTVLLITGALLMCAATVLAFRPVIPAAVVAYAGMMLMRWSGYAVVSDQTTVFWGAAALIVLVIASLSPAGRRRPYTSAAYIAAGTLAGTVVGLIASRTAMIAGACVGAFLGELAYSRTPAGRTDTTPMIRTLCADGLPAVVTFCITGLTLWSMTAAYTGQ